MTEVYLTGCREYDAKEIVGKMMSGLSRLGIVSGALQGRRVLIKPNLLNASIPEKAVVTHPEFFRASVRLVKAWGGRPVMAESPAFQPLAKVMKKTGYDRVVNEEGCEVADPKDTAVLFWEGGETFKRFEISKAFFDADVVVNLPKLKTHGLTYLTGAVKNLFGLVYGLNKSQWHLRARSGEEFSGLLLDLYAALLHGFERPKTFIHMMDAVTGMEGEGPGISGVPKKIGALLVGQDALSVDAVAVRLVNLDMHRVHTLTLGQKRKLGTAALEDIQILGDRLDALEVLDYVPSKAAGDPSPVSRWPLNTNFFRDLLIERPVPSKDRCTLCYQCKAICPGGAIEKSNGRSPVPIYNYHKCIRCYCCMEICPEAAIRLKRGKLQWLFRTRAK
ncbi:MAG: DUF362 domain-containing protein [Deltaproteobacteria bacterium]|nr:DUF362 domain-containing protein [Deltaproteobacteria bacterium]